ncbi:MAG TPA: hypothetical protein VEY30_04965, partial [Myxococcaceae bacterium]|nr:hypothetical protein [Myxococcaceae bacterium]
MRQVLLRSAYLLRNPVAALAVLVLAGGGSALTAVPLFGVPGFELGEATATAVGLLGGAVGIAAAFLERRLIQSRDPRPRSALRRDGPGGAAVTAFGAALCLLLAALAVPFAAAVGRALVTSDCSPFTHAAFYPLLALPSAVLAAAAGVFCGFAVRSGWAAALLYASLVVLSVGWTAWPLVFGPQAHAFNHFLGYWPGPLYDEALRIRPALNWFRLQTLLAAGFLGFL